MSQSDVVELEQEFNVTVLRIRYQNSKVGALSALSNESALILNLVCDKLFVHCLKGNRPVTDTVMIWNSWIILKPIIGSGISEPVVKKLSIESCDIHIDNRKFRECDICNLKW